MKQTTDFSNVETLRAFLRFHNEKAEESNREYTRHVNATMRYRAALRTHEPKGKQS